MKLALTSSVGVAPRAHVQVMDSSSGDEGKRPERERGLITSAVMAIVIGDAAGWGAVVKADLTSRRVKAGTCALGFRGGEYAAARCPSRALTVSAVIAVSFLVSFETMAQMGRMTGCSVVAWRRSVLCSRADRRRWELSPCRVPH